jgi:hypothetical protein
VRPAEHRISVEADGAARPQRGLEAPERVRDGGGRGVVEPALERGGGRRLDAGAQSLELVEPRAQVRARRPRGELAQRRLQRDAELERGLAMAAGGEIGAGAQRELLARERGVATAEQRGQALVGTQRGAAPPASKRGNVERARPPASATCSPAPRPTRATSACARATSRTYGSAVAVRWRWSSRLSVARAAATSASGSTRASQRSAAAPSSNGRAAISVTRAVATGAGAGAGGAAAGRRLRRPSRARCGAPSVARTTTCVGSPAWPRMT